MVLNLLTLAVEQRHVIPTGALMLGTIPHYWAALAWNVVSLPLPESWRVSVQEAMWGFYQRYVLFVFETVSGVELHVYGKDVGRITDTPERAIYISNHQCTVDWVVTDMLAARSACLGGIRYLLKDSLLFIPLYGWYFYDHGCVYVRRGGNFQQDIALKQLSRLKTLRNPFWLVIFPEGTRYAPSKVKQRQAADKFCEERGLAKLEHTLAPRHRGMFMAVNQLRGELDAIYDVTVRYEGGRDPANTHVDAPSMFGFVCCPQNSKLHVNVDRIQLNDVPEDEKLFSAWLHQRWQIKDRLLTQMYNGEPIADEVKTAPLPLAYTLTAAITYTAAIVPAFVYPKVGKAYATTWLIGGVLMVAFVKIRRGA